jgi:hypothetical protein
MFSKHYQRVVEEFGCAFLDASEVIVASGVDGVHLELSEHRKLGRAVATRVRENLSA